MGVFQGDRGGEEEGRRARAKEGKGDDDDDDEKRAGGEGGEERSPPPPVLSRPQCECYVEGEATGAKPDPEAAISCTCASPPQRRHLPARPRPPPPPLTVAPPHAREGLPMQLGVISLRNASRWWIAAALKSSSSLNLTSHRGIRDMPLPGLTRFITPSTAHTNPHQPSRNAHFLAPLPSSSPLPPQCPSFLLGDGRGWRGIGLEYASPGPSSPSHDRHVFA